MMKTTHPTTSPEIQRLENEINAKKAELAKLISETNSTLVKDYSFLAPNNIDIQLSELFEDKDELIVVFYMGYQCKYCTLWADGYNGLYEHLSDRTTFVVVSHETPLFQQELRKDRNWKFPMFSRANNTFAEDLGFTKIDEENRPLPGIASFLKKEGEIYLHHKTFFGPGDNFCIFWDIMNILPKGINNWVPQYNY